VHRAAGLPRHAAGGRGARPRRRRTPQRGSGHRHAGSRARCGEHLGRAAGLLRARDAGQRPVHCPEAVAASRASGRDLVPADLKPGYVPAVRFYFEWQALACLPEARFDGVHPVKLHHELRLDDVSGGGSRSRQPAVSDGRHRGPIQRPNEDHQHRAPQPAVLGHRGTEHSQGDGLTGSADCSQPIGPHSIFGQHRAAMAGTRTAVTARHTGRERVNVPEPPFGAAGPLRCKKRASRRLGRSALL